MSISYPLTKPTHPGFCGVVWTPHSAVAMTQSPFSMAQKIYDWGGKMRTVELSLPQMSIDEGKQWMGFFMALNGIEGTFYLSDTLGKTASGTGEGYPLVDGGSQTGAELVTKGWKENTENILKAGDWFSISDVLYQVTQNVDSDAGGNATLDIWPDLRSSPADEAELDIWNPRGIFRLTEPVPIGWNKEWLTDGFTFVAMEAL